MIRYIVTLSILLFIAGCEGEPLLTSFTQSSMKLVYKGTYASNNPRQWWDGETVEASVLVDDSAENAVPETLPEFLLLDIAEVRMNNQKFGWNRSYVKTSLSENNALLNGKGVEMDCVDLGDGNRYNKLEIYLRKLIYNGAEKFTSSWNVDSSIKEQFGNDKLNGYDVLFHYKYSQEDVDDSNSPDNLVFPFTLKLAETYTHKRDRITVVEFRIVLKNNIKYYEYEDSDDDLRIGFFGPGDYTVNVENGNKYFGGNLIGAVHVYNPQKTLTISGTAPSGTYVVAILESKSIEDYLLTDEIPPLATWCEDGTYTLENVMSGESYKLYYSENTPSAVNSELPSGFTGETLVETDASQIGTEITVNL
jgi:hypothetical protein